MVPEATPDRGTLVGPEEAVVSASLSLDVPAQLIKDPRAWSVQDISIWLQWLGIGEHVEAFAAGGVDGHVLMQLSTEAAWEDLGVVDPAQQRVLDSAVEPLRCFRDAEDAESGLALHAIEGPAAGEVFFVGAGGVTGGRHSASNGIVLSENFVSRRHFQITRDVSGQYLLQDVGSTTGTFLMVRAELLLEDLMILQLGTTELTVHLEEDICTLETTEGPDKDGRATVPPQGIFVGREASSGFCIRDPQISAFHCEIRQVPEQGFILDDKYSTNRTWLRLAADGQQSKRFMLHVGDLFKVGSTLFHVVDPASVVPEAELSALVPRHQHGGMDHGRDPAGLGRQNPGGGSARDEDDELGDDEDPRVVPSGHAVSSARGAGSGGEDSDWDIAASPGLVCEPFTESDPRPALSPEEYARLLTASRRRMQSDGVVRRSMAGMFDGEDAGMNDLLHERELSSLQQRMRNSRAQQAYSSQQDRPNERRDEDLCKICYDRDIDVVLYPCGHFVLCRWCAQKVSDCPVCRFVITDVIRTYKA